MIYFPISLHSLRVIVFNGEGGNFPSRGHLEMSGNIMVITTASTEQKPGMLLNMLKGIGQSKDYLGQDISAKIGQF